MGKFSQNHSQPVVPSSLIMPRIISSIFIKQVLKHPRLQKVNINLKHLQRVAVFPFNTIILTVKFSLVSYSKKVALLHNKHKASAELTPTTRIELQNAK